MIWNNTFGKRGNKVKLKNSVYDILKWVALIALPALATFYGVIAKVWNLPFGEQIVTTLNAIGVLIGVLIGVSQYNYDKTK